MCSVSIKPYARSGFTIVELLIVIIVIGILAALVLVAYSNVTDQARATNVKADLNQAAKQLGADRERNGGVYYPTSLAAANNGNGISPSSGNSFTYTPLPATNPTAYCLTSVNGTQIFFVQNGSAVQAGTCPTQGLVGWWKLNGDFSDSTGNGYGGVYSGATSPSSAVGQNGATNGAYTFSSNYIAVSSLSGVMNGQSAFTISGWAKPVATPAGHATYFGYRNNSNFNFYILQLQGTNNLECRYTGTGGQSQPSGVSITPASWQLTTLVFDGSTTKCYVNTTGYSASASTSGVPGGTGEFEIGAASGTNSMNGGTVDDVRLYNRALSAQDVQNLYSLGAQ